MRVISTANASSVQLDGVTYEADSGGVFDFPEPVGVELTTKHASMWVAEDTFNTQAAAAQRDALRDPNFMVTVVAGLLGRVSALEEQLAALKAPEPEQAPEEAPEPDLVEQSDPPVSAAPDGGDGSTPEPPAPEAAPEEPKKQTAAQKRAAAKKAAAAEAPTEPDPDTGGE